MTGIGENTLAQPVKPPLRERRACLAKLVKNRLTLTGVDWGWFPDPWRFVRCGWEPGARRLILFQELSANRKTPAETG